MGKIKHFSNFSSIFHSFVMFCLPLSVRANSAFPNLVTCIIRDLSLRWNKMMEMSISTGRGPLLLLLHVSRKEFGNFLWGTQGNQFLC